MAGSSEYALLSIAVGPTANCWPERSQLNEYANGIHKAYVELLVRYQGTLDLLSGQGLRDIDRLVAESVAYAEAVEKVAGDHAKVVDVGSGAGLPGIVMAASLPEASFVLVERRRRRGAFLELAASRLGLANVRVIKGDVRDIVDLCADVITAQAVAKMAEVVRLTRHLHSETCHVVSRRGPEWLQEIPAVTDLLKQERMDSEHADDDISTSAEDGPAVAVAVERRLDHRGSLIALRLTGGPACRSSG